MYYSDFWQTNHFLCVWMCVPVCMCVCVCERERSTVPDKKRPTLMRGILGSSYRSLFSKLWSRETPLFLASWLQINREHSVQGQVSWCHGMRSGTQDWNKEGGRWKTLRKETTKKITTIMFQGCPMIPACRSFLSRQAGEQWAGFWWWCTGIQ